MNAGLTRAQIAELCGCRASDIPKERSYSLTQFNAPGPVCQAYIRSLGPIDVITGPAGSGKTVGTIFKLIRFACGAMPACRDGVVRVRGTALRDNYRAMYRTTLRSWFEFVPPDFGGAIFTGGQDRPAQHIIRLSGVREGREVPIELTMDFFAVGDVQVEELLKGYETTFVWANEGDLLQQEVIPFAYSRTGRYPKETDMPPGVRRPRFVAVDMNPPDIDHPLWKACETGTFLQLESGTMLPAAERVVNFFHQPSGLSPEAENRAGKSYEAYELESRTMPEQKVRRFVHGQPGYALDGKPVYTEFDYKRHVAGGPVHPIEHLPLDMGFDQGLSPGAILFQTATTGQVRVLAELIPDHGTGVSRFLEMLNVLLYGRFRGLQPGLYGSDPAGFYGADRLGGEMSWSEAVSLGLRHPVLPAPSNEPVIRIESVKLLLRTMIDANTPGLLIDPSCRMLIGGFAAHYKYRRIRAAGASDRFDDRPFKNDYATAHDALQYGVLTRRGRAGVITDAAKAGRAGNVIPLNRAPTIRPGDFNLWAV